MTHATLTGKSASAVSGERRRSGSDTRQRTEQVNFKFLPGERKRIEEEARKVGITGNGHAQRYMRYLLGFDAVPSTGN